MIKLYSKQAAAAWKKRAVLRLGGLWGLMLGMLAVNIFLCTTITGRNGQQVLFCMIGLSVLAGWAAILLYAYGYRPAKARAVHMAGIVQEEGEIFSGVLRRTEDVFTIPNSVTVRQITLETNGETKRFQADTALLRQLPKDSTEVTVEVVRKFITGYEVMK